MTALLLCPDIAQCAPGDSITPFGLIWYQITLIEGTVHVKNISGCLVQVMEKAKVCLHLQHARTASVTREVAKWQGKGSLRLSPCHCVPARACQRNTAMSDSGPPTWSTWLRGHPLFEGFQQLVQVMHVTAVTQMRVIFSRSQSVQFQ